MKSKIFGAALLAAALLISTGVQAQKQLPAATVKTLSGKPYPVNDCFKDGVPVVISFWHTACKPCLQELDAISENYGQWQKTVKFKVLAVSIDDSRNASKVGPLASGRDWPFTVVIDTAGEFKRAMNITTTPATFIVDRTGKIVYSHLGYTPGGEYELLEKLKELK